jgi:pimeloyl-ACP methyl ester carboxylesterase
MDDIYIELSQTTIYGKTAGDPDRPLILGIHGWSQRNGWHTWEPVMADLATADFYVVSIDMPGWGKSPPVINSPLGGQQAVTVVIDIIDGLHKDSAVLMGKSWGGGVAIKTAVDFADRVSHLILSAPALRNYEQLKNLQQPVLLVWAEDDPVIPFANAERFTAAIPNVRLVTYPTGGHSAAPKNAADFAPKAAEFLTKN